MADNTNAPSAPDDASEVIPVDSDVSDQKPDPAKKKKMLLALLISGIVLLLIIVSVLLALLFSKQSGSNNVQPTPTVTTTVATSITPTVETSPSITPTVSQTPAPTSSAFSITGLSGNATETNYQGSCPHTFNFTATVTAMNSGTVTYHWERSDGASSTNSTLNFSGGGSHTQDVNYSWTFGASGESGSHFVKMVITFPTNTSLTMNFSKKCSYTGNWLIKLGPANSQGTMALTQSGNNISGTYSHSGTSGTITNGVISSSGRAISGNWNINGLSGNFFWHFISDSNTFRGNFDGPHKWCGTYEGGTLPADFECYEANP